MSSNQDRARYLQNAAETVAYSLGIIAEMAAGDKEIPRSELSKLILAEQKVLQDAVSGVWQNAIPKVRVPTYYRNIDMLKDFLLEPLELAQPVFPIGKLCFTAGAMDSGFGPDPEGGDEVWTFDEGMRPFIERFLRGDWNLTDPEDCELNTAASKIHNGHIFDAFTYQGKRYNIEGFVGIEMVVLLASER